MRSILGSIILTLAASTMLASEISLDTEEFVLPTRGSMPHDLLIDGNGVVWHTTRRRSVVGAFDPTTGKFEEFVRGDSAFGFHGLTADKNGDIWYSNPGFSNSIGKLNPLTGRKKTFAFNIAGAGWPEALVFDDSGNLWFTLANGNTVGATRSANRSLCVFQRRNQYTPP